MPASPVRVPPNRPVAVDLFAGAGGLSLGFEQAGFDVVTAVECDPVHAATHAFNFPQSQVLCRDVLELSADDLRKTIKTALEKTRPGAAWDGQVDAIIGGPPCQGFSIGGRQEQGDPRNRLLLQFVRLVEELKPRTFCLENVAGLLSERFDDARQEVFERLAHAGYAMSGTDTPVNSLDFGVPQSRRRVVVLGAFGSDAPSLPLPVVSRTSVEDALDGLPSPVRYAELSASDEVSLLPDDIERRFATASPYARGLAGIDQIPGDRSRPRMWEPSRLTGSRRTKHTDATVGRFAATPPGTVEPKSRLYRLPLSGPARTLRAGTGPERGSHTSPRPIHPVEDRVITVREAARLHGYPDWFRFHTTNWHGHRQVGNSVPPPLAQAAGFALLDSLGGPPIPSEAAIPLGDASLLVLPCSKARAAIMTM